MALRRTRVTSIPASIGLTLLAGVTAFALIAYVQWRAERSREAQISLASMRADALRLRTLPWDAADAARGASTERALRALEQKVRAELSRLETVPGRRTRVAALLRDESAYERALADLLTTVTAGNLHRARLVDDRAVRPGYGRFAAALDRDAWSYETVADQALVVTIVGSALAIAFAIAVFTALLLRSERMRRAQRRSEEQYRLLFEHNPHPMWVYDVETLRFLAVNEAAVEQYGYSEAEFAAMTIADIRPADDVPRLQEFAQELVDAPTSSGVWQHIRKDGTQIEAEISSHQIEFRGRTARVVLAHDVSAQAAALRAVRESERRYRDLFENAHDLIATVDLDHRLTSVNRAFARTLGYEPAELVGRRLTEFVPAGEKAALDQAYEEKLSGVAEGSMYEHELVAKDGSLITIEVATRLILGGDRPIGVQAICRDVTRRRRAEAELRESRELYRLVVEHSKDMITLIRPDGEIVYASPSHAHVLGYAPDQLVGRNVAEFLHPDDLEHMVGVLRATLDGDTKDTITRLRRTDGEYVTVEGAGSRIRGAGGTPMVLSSSRDVSERMRARELEERLAQAQRLEAIGRLAGGIAHDFNNILTAMNGYGDLALALLAEPTADPELRECVREMRSAGTKATQLTGQLLAFNRKQMLDSRALDINAAVREYEPMLTRLLGDHIAVRLELGDEPIGVLADEGQLGQVIVNLAVNARDTMPDGGTVTITTEVLELSGDEVPYGLEAGSFVRLAVKDCGAGIPPDVRDKIFDPFFTTKDRGEGTGLGLATVLGIVQQSGGQVTVESEPGRGSTFSVYLPRIAAPAPAADEGRADRAGERSANGRELVLLVEDNDVVRRLARSVLADAGYEVVEAETPERALELAGGRKEPIDLVVTDVVMPGMNGRELADELRRRQPDLRVLFTSGYTDDVVLSTGTLQNGTAFLQKPFGVDELQRKVRELLESAPYAA